jgi:hypothetical protein
MLLLADRDPAYCPVACRHMLTVALMTLAYPDTWKERLVRSEPKAHAPAELLLATAEDMRAEHPELSTLVHDLLTRAKIL